MLLQWNKPQHRSDFMKLSHLIVGFSLAALAFTAAIGRAVFDVVRVVFDEAFPAEAPLIATERVEKPAAILGRFETRSFLARRETRARSRPAQKTFSPGLGLFAA